MRERYHWQDEVRYILRRANGGNGEDYEGLAITRKLEEELDFHPMTYIKIETIRFNNHEIVVKIKQYDGDYHVMPDVVRLNTEEFLKVFDIKK